MIEKITKLDHQKTTAQCSTHGEQLTFQDEQIQFQHIPKYSHKQQHFQQHVVSVTLYHDRKRDIFKKDNRTNSTNQHFLTQNYYNGKDQILTAVCGYALCQCGSNADPDTDSAFFVNADPNPDPEVLMTKN